MWKNRIVGFKEEHPDQLLANPFNWRIHSAEQQDLFVKVAGDIGFIAPVIANAATGKIIDGHMRVALALRHGVTKIPVLYVELSEAEEREALATFDSIGAMAVCDNESLTSLLDEVCRCNESFSPFVDQILEAEGVKVEEFKERPQREPRPKEDIECPVCGTIISSR